MRQGQLVHSYCCWFDQEADGRLCFTPPAFRLVNGTTEFINGRHRAVVLARHMEAFPSLLTAYDKASSAHSLPFASANYNPGSFSNCLSCPSANAGRVGLTAEMSAPS